MINCFLYDSCDTEPALKLFHEIECDNSRELLISHTNNDVFVTSYRRNAASYLALKSKV